MPAVGGSLNTTFANFSTSMGSQEPGTGRRSRGLCRAGGARYRSAMSAAPTVYIISWCRDPALLYGATMVFAT
ncbi:MAG: hypothetical protein JO013_13430, partial [Alphaproteobacteria bacterium]|nr:hypothetical protein [Alphaproteobacteria bacterium]